MIVVRDKDGIVVNIGKWPRLEGDNLPGGYTESNEEIVVLEDGSRVVKQ